MIENYNVFKGIKQVFESTYTALTNSQKEGYLWFVRKDSATTVGDVYFGAKKYAEATDISIKADKSEAISALSLTMDSEYKLTLSGRTADGSGFTVSDVIDLPLETMVVSGAYDSANTQIVLTLKNGSTTSFPVSALVDGLQSEITAQNTLSADLITDGTTNKVVTGTDKTNWNNAYASAHTHTNKSVLDGIVANDITNWNNAYASAHTHSNIDILDAIDSSAVNTLYSAIQGVTLNGESFTPDTANTVNLTADTFDGTIEIYGSDETPLNNVETPGVYKVVYLPAQSNGGDAMRGANPNAVNASVLIVTDNNGRAQQAEYLGETIRYRWEYSGAIKSINWVNWVYFHITDVTGNMSNWNEAYGNSHVHNNWSIIDNITSADTENWDNAYASAHTHTNKSTLDGISSTDVTNWNNAASSAHSHSNSTVLDNLTQTVIDNSHTHSNKTALDAITTGKTQNWDNAYASAHTHSNQSVLDNLTQGVIDSAHTHTNKSVLDDISSSDVDKWDAAIQGVRVNGVDVTPDTGNVIDITISEGEGGDDIDYSTQYLTFEAIEDTTFTFTRNPLQYSLDDGATWTNLSSDSHTPTVSVGNKILWKQGTTTPSIIQNYGMGTFSATGSFKAYGNVMSLCYGDNFIGEVSLSGKNYILQRLFRQNTYLVDSSNLVLPATTLANQCYGSMFSGCTSLTSAPKILPATSLTYYCYQEMFIGCTSLTSAPELPAPTLSFYTYSNMFNGCTSLNYIKCLATNISATNCTSDWVKNVSSTGVFIKADGMNGWTVGNNGIPTGWVDSTESEYDYARGYQIPKKTSDLTNDSNFITSDDISGKTDSTTFGTHSATTIANGTSSQMHLPTVSASDNNKVLMVVNGVWTLVTPSMIYSGSGAPDNSQGNDGDIYIQTS